MAESGHIGPIEIRVPSNPYLSRVLRLAASGMASLAEYTVDEIEDIKIAVSELLIALIEHGDGKAIDLSFEVDEQTFRMRGRTAVDSFDLSHPDLLLCRAVLTEVCANHNIDLLENHVHIRAEVTHTIIE